MCGKYLKIRFGVVILLIILFLWWGAKAIERYWSQPLTTDSGYSLSEDNKNGIQFPVITFCHYEETSKNPLLKNCNNDTWDFFPSFSNCIKTDKNFNAESFMSTLQMERKNIIDEVRLYTGSVFIDLSNMGHNVWSAAFQYNFGLCYSFDLSNIKASLCITG